MTMQAQTLLRFFTNCTPKAYISSFYQFLTNIGSWSTNIKAACFGHFWVHFYGMSMPMVKSYFSLLLICLCYFYYQSSLRNSRGAERDISLLTNPNCLLLSLTMHNLLGTSVLTGHFHTPDIILPVLFWHLCFAFPLQL